MESKSYNFRELLSGCKNSNYIHEFVLYFKLCAVGTLFRKGSIIKPYREKDTEGMGWNTTDDSKDGIVKYLLRNPNTCFVAEDNGKLIGVIIRGHDGRRGFIYHTTVKKEYRGQGIEKKLVDSAMKALEAEGIHKVAFEKNVSGNAFWEKVGFTVREDLVYRNKNIHQLKRVDLI